MGDEKQPSERVEAALALLSEELRAQLAIHPAGHLLAGRGTTLDLKLRLPLLPRDGDLSRAATVAGEQLAAELASLLARKTAFKAGRVYCLRCAGTSCEHSAPAAAREVFAGYGPSGLPRFLDLPSWLLARADPRIDQLYEEPPRFLSHLADEAMLTADLLPAYRDLATGYRLHGQVAAGWFRGSDAQGHPASVAVTFQVLSTRSQGGRRIYGLNLVGVGPDGEPLESFCHRLGEVPWAVAVRWGQRVLDEIGEMRRGRPEAREARIAGLLGGLAARLEKDKRAEGRRTRHAEERHRAGDRPTRMALADLARAALPEVLVDARRDTLVIVGDRGRAHVWSREGKLVTSVRYSPEAIERRKKEGLWRPAREEELAALRGRTAPP